MSCPPDIHRLVTDILGTALLRLRHFGAAGDAEACEIEANHVHNLPALLEDYAPELLAFYWNVERTEFLEQRADAGVEQFDDAWQELEQYVAQTPAASSTGRG